MMTVLAGPKLNRSRSGATVSIISQITKESEETKRDQFLRKVIDLSKINVLQKYTKTRITPDEYTGMLFSKDKSSLEILQLYRVKRDICRS